MSIRHSSASAVRSTSSGAPSTSRSPDSLGDQRHRVTVPLSCETRIHTKPSAMALIVAGIVLMRLSS